MPATTPPANPTVSTPPTTDDPINFDPRMDAWLLEQTTILLPYFIAIGANVYANALYAEGRANAADASADTAGDHADDAEAARDQANLFAQTAVNAPGTSGTSTTSVAVGSGTKTLTTQPGKAWVPGQPVVISRTAAPTTVQMYGKVSSYDIATGVLVVPVPAAGVVGSGTYTDWTIALVGQPGVAGVLPVVPVPTSQTAVAGFHHLITASGVTLTMPAGATGDEIEVTNVSGSAAPVVQWGANKLRGGTPGAMTLNKDRLNFRVRQSGNATYGWV